MSLDDLRVIIRTPDHTALDVHACELEVEDPHGRFIVTAHGDEALAALVPSTVVVRQRDGHEIHVHVSWGSLTAAGGEARMVVSACSVVHVAPLRIAG
jgi:F0F1-type ATP synthase epsilon subunit